MGTVIGLLVGYGLGRLHAIWQRARTDYVKTRDSVPVLRKAKWTAFGGLLNRGVVVVGLVAFLVVWLMMAG